MSTPPPFSVLNICMGNICRSPMMERLLVSAVRPRLGGQASELLLVHGAGTGGWHAGSQMDPLAARQLRRLGGDPTGFVARRLLPEHIEASDLVLTATADQSDFVAELVGDARERTFVFGELTRYLREIDLVALPPFAPNPDAVYARGVAIVEAMAKARGSAPPLVSDELDDPWGMGVASFSKVADVIEATVRRFASVLLGEV